MIWAFLILFSIVDHSFTLLFIQQTHSKWFHMLHYMEYIARLWACEACTQILCCTLPNVPYKQHFVQIEKMCVAEKHWFTNNTWSGFNISWQYTYNRFNTLYSDWLQSNLCVCAFIYYNYNSDTSMRVFIAWVKYDFDRIFGASQWNIIDDCKADGIF